MSKRATSRPGFLRGHGKDHMLTSINLYRCPWCGKKRGLTHLEFYDTNGFSESAPGYKLVYPSSGTADTRMTICVVSHAECGSDTGYAVEISEIIKDPNDWYRHLNKKIWGGRWIEDVIWDLLLIFLKDKQTFLFTPRTIRLDNDRSNN